MHARRVVGRTGTQEAGRKRTPEGFSLSPKAWLDAHAAIRSTFDKIREDNIRFLAGAVAWSLLTSVFPISVGLLAITNLLFRSYSQQHVIVRQISRALQGVMSPQYLERLVNLTIQHSGITAVIGIVAVAWAAENVGFSISASFAAMFEVRERGFWDEKLVHLGMFLVFVILTLVISAGTAALYHFLLLGPFDTVLRTAFTLAAAFVLFSVVYIVYPNTEKRFTLENVWRGSLVAAVLFQALAFIWPLYESSFSEYGGILFPLLVLVLWIYFFSLIMLIGAEIGAISTLDDAQTHGREPGPAASETTPEHGRRHQKGSQKPRS